MPLTIYIAASFKHMHGVRLLNKEFSRLGCQVLDWTSKAAPPPGLTPAERRAWMDTDQAGGEVYSFCRSACLGADLIVYYGASGQDAGVEIGMASAVGAPILGIRGPLEAPGLMLHGAVTAWVESVEAAVDAIAALTKLNPASSQMQRENLPPAAAALAHVLRKRNKKDSVNQVDVNDAGR